MNNKEYILLIEENREVIQKHGEKAFADSCNHENLYYSVILWNDGRVSTMAHDNMGLSLGNEAIEIMRIHENPFASYEASENPEDNMDDNEYIELYIKNYASDSVYSLLEEKIDKLKV